MKIISNNDECETGCGFVNICSDIAKLNLELDNEDLAEHYDEVCSRPGTFGIIGNLRCSLVKTYREELNKDLRIN